MSYQTNSAELICQLRDATRELDDTMLSGVTVASVGAADAVVDLAQRLRGIIFAELGEAAQRAAEIEAARKNLEKAS